MINVTCTTELNRQKAIAASARKALSATDNNSTTSDNKEMELSSYSSDSVVTAYGQEFTRAPARYHYRVIYPMGDR